MSGSLQINASPSTLRPAAALPAMAIRGLGTAVPAHWIEQQDAAEWARVLQFPDGDRPLPVAALYRRAGVETRHSVVLESSTNGTSAWQSFYRPAESSSDHGPPLSQRMERYEQEAGALAVAGARRALTAADIHPNQVTHLITVSCTGFAAPGFDVELCRTLPLARAVARTHVGFMGCHAMLNALRMAHAFTVADPAAVVLICAVELCTLHHQYSRDAGQIVSNSLFADGAAALVGTSSDAPRTGPWRLIASGSTIVPDTLEQMTWRLGDHGFLMSLSAQLPATIATHLRPWLEGWLAEHGLTVPQVRSWAVHPGGPRILSAVAEALGIDPAALGDSREILRRYGNMSSPTVVFILERLSSTGAGGPCVLLAFGPGLTVEVALLT